MKVTFPNLARTDGQAKGRAGEESKGKEMSVPHVGCWKGYKTRRWKGLSLPETVEEEDLKGLLTRSRSDKSKLYTLKTGKQESIDTEEHGPCWELQDINIYNPPSLPPQVWGWNLKAGSWHGMKCLVFDFDETQHVSGVDEAKQLGPVSGHGAHPQGIDGWRRRVFLKKKMMLCVCW